MEDQSEEAIMAEKISEKQKEANTFAQNEISPINHHIQFILQKAYFKCAYECFDRGIRKKDDVDECVDYCSVPALKAHYLLEDELSRFQDGLKESMRVCQDKFEIAKNIQKNKINTMNELDSCLDQSVKESTKTLPYIVERLKRFISID